MKILISACFGLITALPAWALDVQKVTDNVYALVGELSQRSPDNLGNNATFGVVVTDDGVILIDAGGSWKGAQDIQETIATFTDQPVKVVINSGGQDHRWLGNGYWKEQGATIIASTVAVADQQDRESTQMTLLSALIGPGLEGTEPVYADTVFDTDYHLELGNAALEIYYCGQAHTPGDSYVWLADQSVVFTGDIVFVNRLLGIGEQSYSLDWINAFETMAELDPAHVVPGHGPATDMLTATADTYDYLVNLRTKMGEHIENGGDIIGSVDVDQSAFSYLAQFDSLAKRNAQAVFSEMEFE